MEVLKELGAYSVLLEMQSNPGLQALGKRLGEIADIVAKEAQAPRCWCLDDNGKSLCVPGAEPVNPAPAPEAVLLKDMAVWWQNNSSVGQTPELYDFTMRAFQIVNKCV